MRVLAVADVESRSLYDFYAPGKLDGFDLIVSCGDLRAAYLEFLVTLAGCPLLYVHGNHDGAYEEEPPGGCTCIDGRIVNLGGLRIMGLGGSFAYAPGPHRYTEREMALRMARLMPRAYLRRGVDLLVTHAPARGLGDTDEPSHRGFSCFRWLLDHQRPSYFLHGHMHLNYGMHVPRRTDYGPTTILNAYDHVVFEL